MRVFCGLPKNLSLLESTTLSFKQGLLAPKEVLARNLVVFWTPGMIEAFKLKVVSSKSPLVFKPSSIIIVRRLVSNNLELDRYNNKGLRRYVTKLNMENKAGPFVAAIDQGTSSTRVILYDAQGQNLLSHQVPLNLITPVPGWVEQDPMEILKTVEECMAQVSAKALSEGYKLTSETLKAVGITNQRETTVVWDKFTGKPLYNTIVWSDARTHKIVAKLGEKFADDGGLDKFRPTTGLPISTYFSAIKLKWLIKHVAAIKSAVDEKRALFGTVDSWLIWNLTGASQDGAHVTDVTNASRTLLLDLKTLDWDKNICQELEIPEHVLPQVRSSAEIYGHINNPKLPVWNGVPIAGCLGDQQSALVGQKCLSTGLAKSTYGTGCFVLYNTGKEIVHSAHGLLSTVGYQLGPKAPAYYALEGSISTAGSGLDWIRNSLELKESTKELVELAGTVPNTAGVYFVPSFNGLLAPRWRPDARGIIIGLTFFTKKPHIVRAMLQSIAFQATDVLSAMEKDSGSKIESLRVDGGLSNSDLLMQMQSDSLGSIVERPADIESTARGAAFAAGLAVGLFPENSEGHPMLEQHMSQYHPKIDAATRAIGQKRWDKAVERSLDWIHEGEFEDETE